MFAPLVAKAKSTGPQPAKAVDQTHTSRPGLGDQATSGFVAPQPSRTGSAPGAKTTGSNAARAAGQGTAPSWDFSKISLHPSGLAGQPQTSPLHWPPRLPIQAKLKVGAVDDPLEREADRVADQVMRMPAPEVATTPAPPQVSRKCADCEEDDKLQRKDARPTAPAVAPPSVHAALRSPGQPLDAATRAYFEPRFGRDFSGVRVHTDASAAQSAQEMNAHAFTVGHDVAFDSGRFAPASQEGRRLLAHELTHVAQQRETVTALQRKPKRTVEQNEKRAAILAKAAQVVFASMNEQLDAQSDAEAVLGLDSKRSEDKTYGWQLGQSDKARMGKSGTLSKDHQHEITVKIRFFDGEAKAAYIRTIEDAVSSSADPAVVPEMLAEPEIRQSPEEEAEGLGCDAGLKQFPLLYEGEPEKSTCMDITADHEFIDNYFDLNIVGADAYSVPGTTWENVEYRSFNSLVVKYKNGKSEYFMLDDVGNFYFGGQTLSLVDFLYLKREATGLVYPVTNGHLYSNEVLTPKLISYKKGLQYKVKELQDLFTLVKTAGAFASIIGSYSLVEAFRASIEGFKIPRGTGKGGSKGTRVTRVVTGVGGENEENVGNVRVSGTEGEVGDAAAIDQSLAALGVEAEERAQLSTGAKIWGQTMRGRAKLVTYIKLQGKKLTAGILSSELPKVAGKTAEQIATEEKPNVIKGFLSFRQRSMALAKQVGADTLRIEGDVVVNPDLRESLLKSGFKEADDSPGTFFKEEPVK
jgi:hypothetical protein